MRRTPLVCMTLAIFIVSCFLIRPYFLQSRGMWYVDDDYDYFAHSSAMAFGQYPSYKKEFFTIMKEGPQSPIGTGILAAPFVFVFSFVDRIEGSTIIETRTQDNIVGSWSQFGFQFASIFYFVTACYLLFLGLSRFTSQGVASMAVIVMMICQGLPLFVYRRPFFSHCSELFLQSALMCLFLEHLAEPKKGPMLRRMAATIVLAGLLYLTRPNDILFALMWPLLVMDYSKGILHVWQQLRWGIFLLTGMILIFKVLPDVVNHMHPYSWAGAYLGTPMSPADFFRRIVHIFIGTDWGLVFTTPFLVLSLGGTFLLWRQGLKRFFWLLLPMAVNFYVIIAWGSQGGWYGYRYFIPSAIPVMIFPLALGLQWLSKKMHLWVLPLIILVALPPVISMIAFEGCGYFNLDVMPVDFNRTDWTNPDLQSNIWGAVVHAPGEFCFIVSQGLLSLWLSITGAAPVLTPVTWLRILIILAIPWFMFTAGRMFFYRDRISYEKNFNRHSS